MKAFALVAASLGERTAPGPRMEFPIRLSQRYIVARRGIGGRAASDLARPKSLQPLRHTEPPHVNRQRTSRLRCRFGPFGHPRLGRGHNVVVPFGKHGMREEDRLLRREKKRPRLIFLRRCSRMV